MSDSNVQLSFVNCEPFSANCELKAPLQLILSVNWELRPSLQFGGERQIFNSHCHQLSNSAFEAGHTSKRRGESECPAIMLLLLSYIFQESEDEEYQMLSIVNVESRFIWSHVLCFISRYSQTVTL